MRKKDEILSMRMVCQNLLISLFGNCHQIIAALEVFDRIQIKDIVSVNSIMDAYRDCMMYSVCVALFKEIDNGDLLLFIIAIKACTEGNLWCDGLNKDEYKWMLR
eukprot:790485_1